MNTRLTLHSFVPGGANLEQRDIAIMIEIRTALRGGIYCGLEDPKNRIYTIGPEPVGSIKQQFLKNSPR